MFEAVVARMPTFLRGVAVGVSFFEVFVARRPTLPRGASVRVSVSLGPVDASFALSWGPGDFCVPFWVSIVAANSPDVMCLAVR